MIIWLQHRVAHVLLKIFRIVKPASFYGSFSDSLSFFFWMTLVTFMCLIYSYCGGALHKSGWPPSIRSGLDSTCADTRTIVPPMQMDDDYGDFGVSFAATVSGRCTRRGRSRLSVLGEPLLVPKRELLYLLCKAAPQQDPDLSDPLAGRAPRLQSELR